MSLIDFSTFMEKLATTSGDTILPFFRTSLGVEDKNKGRSFDPVTEADRAAEAVMRKLISQQFPKHGIVGEEFGSERADAEYVWVLDPIDGTKSFIAGYPVWGTLIALMHNGVPAFGMMHQPFTKERFSGDGGGARYRGPSGDRALRVRRCAGLSDAVLFTTSPLLMSDTEQTAFRRVETEVKLSRYGGDCYAYCMLASGHIDLVVEAGLKSYDIAALVPIVKGAGGIITTWDGGEPQHGGNIIAAGDPRVHAAAMALLKANA